MKYKGKERRKTGPEEYTPGNVMTDVLRERYGIIQDPPICPTCQRMNLVWHPDRRIKT